MTLVKSLGVSSYLHTFATALMVLAAFTFMFAPLNAIAANDVNYKEYSLDELRELVQSVIDRLAVLNNDFVFNTVCPYEWSRSLGHGSVGFDVMNLQKFLNSDPDTKLAISGVGSSGFETQYYGPLTQNAVARFQQKYSAEILLPLGLTKPTGYFGPSTRLEANQQCLSASL